MPAEPHDPAVRARKNPQHPACHPTQGQVPTAYALLSDGATVGFGTLRPSGGDAITLEAMTVRDLVAELTWVEDRLRAQAHPIGAPEEDDGHDRRRLRQREEDICAELRRRRGRPVPAATMPAFAAPPEGPLDGQLESTDLRAAQASADMEVTP